MSLTPPPAPDRATARPIALVAAVAVMALTLVVVVLQMQPPAARGPDAPPDTFSAARALAVLQEVIGDTPHPLGSPAHAQVRERLVARLAALGYTVERQTGVGCYPYGTGANCGAVQNILAELPGTEDGPAVLLMAHYDSGGVSPGAADDGAAVAIVLEVARMMREHGPSLNPVLFLFTDGEERGLLGAQAFVREHPWAQRVGVVINQEARGNRGESMLFETSPDNAWLVDAYAASVPNPAANSLTYEIYRLMPNDTDLSVFKQAGIAGLNFAFIERSVHYHTPLDNLQNLDPRSVQHQGESVLAVARALAERNLEDPPAGDAAYTEILGLFMLRWPAGWTLPLAIAAPVLLAAVVVALVLRRQMPWSALGWGLLAGLLALVGPILLGVGLSALVNAITGLPNPWYTYPLPMRIALWGGAFLCTFLAALLLGRRAGPWGLGVGAWFFWALLALVLAFTVPGAAVMALVPALWAALLLAGVAFTPLAGRPLAWETACTASVFGAALFGLALALNFEAALGFTMSFLITLPVALTAMTLLRFLALPRGRARLRTGLLILAAAAVVGGTAAAVLVAPYTPSAPQIVNVYHVEDRDAGTAYWTAYAYFGPLPGAVQQELSGEPRAVFPWSERTFPVALSAPSDTPAPDAQVLSDEPAGGGRTVRLRLSVARDEDELSLFVPIGQLASLEIGGQTLTPDPPDGWEGRYYVLTCYACDGQELTLAFSDTAPVEMMLEAYTFGLPAGGERLVQGRPAWAMPAYEGDQTVVIKRLRLP